ncbi:hypothetical protein [Flavobacterium hibisci]|nr:hypothetical protein [Flavobacterium hibisci]MBZ4041032.1 hypothetical protein [Flavobacterium hibisci]
MNISHHKANVEESARTSNKEAGTKSTSSRTNEKSNIGTRKSVLMKK